MEEFGIDDEIVGFGQDDEVVSDDASAQTPVQPRPENSGFVDAISDIGAAIPEALTMGFETPGAREERFLREQAGEPAPELSTTQNVLKGAAGGALINAPKNVAELAAAAATYSPIIEAYKYLTGSEGSEFYEEGRQAVAETVEEVLPEFTPQGTAQEWGALGGEIGVGIIAGNKAQAAMKLSGASEAAIASLSEKAPRVVNFFSRLVANAAGTAGTVNSDVDTFVVGENAVLPIMNGLQGMDENEAQEIVRKRLNIFLDAMVLGAPVELLADGGRAVFSILGDSIIKPIRATFLDPTGKIKEGMAFEQFIFALRSAADPKNPGSAVADKYVKTVTEMLSDDEQALIVFPGLAKQGPKVVELDPTSIVRRGMAGDTTPEGARVKEYFGERMKETMDKGGVQIREATERPARELKQYLDEGYEAGGGSAGVRQAADVVQESGERDVARAAAEAENIQFDVDKTRGDFDKILLEDKGLGPKMREAVKKGGSAIGVERNRITGEIISETRRITDEINKISKAKWKNIPKGLPVDENSLTEAVADASQYLDSSSKKALKEAGLDLSRDADEFVEESTIDFAQLQNTLRQPLNAAIRRAKASGVGVEELINLKNNITDVQPEWLGKAKVKGAKKGKKALEEAVGYQKEVVGPDTRSGFPQRLRNIDAEQGLNTVEANQQAFEAFEKATRSKSSPLMEHYANVLAKHGGKQNLFVDHALSSIADDLSDVLRVDGIAAIEPKDVLKALRPYRTTLNTNPKLYGKEIKRLAEFEEKLIANSKNAKNLEALLKEYAKDAEKIRKNIYEESLKEFFSKEGIKNPDAYKSFKKMFLSEQVTDLERAGRLDDVIARMDPGAREGAMSAWMRTVKEELFNADGTLNTTKAAQAQAGANQLFTIGRKLAGEDYQVVDVIQELLDPAVGFQVAKKGPSAKTPESMAGSAAAKRAANRLVLATKGPLTKFGGRVTSFVGTVLDYLKPDEVNTKIAEAILSDRKEFLRMFNDFAARKVEDKKTYRQLFNWLLRVGVYNEGESLDKWYKEVQKINEEAETEELFNEGEK